MKTEEQTRMLLKSYQTRRNNIERESLSIKNQTVYSYNDYLEKLRIYDARIQTVKVILK